MSEEQQKYTTDNQPAAIIDPPRNVTALRDAGQDRRLTNGQNSYIMFLVSRVE